MIKLPAGEPFRLLQISDCHLSRDPARRYRGENADQGLESLFAAISAWQPHGILATGDLSEDASAASYQRLGHYFARLGVPLFVLPGNHDDVVLMQKVFPEGPWDGPLMVHAGDWQLLLLRSAQPGRIDGVIGQADIRFVQHVLNEAPDRATLLALHHQPVAIGSSWIDRHMLEAPADFLNLVQHHPQVRAVVWGHVHQDFASKLANARLLACPSSAANSLPATDRFEPDPAGPACRWLKLYSGGEFETGLFFGQPKTGVK